MAYIAFVRRHAEAAGIAKIIPPQGSWEPDFTFDKKRKVPTKLLSVHQLQTKDTSAAVKHFWEDYNAFLDASGSNKPKKKPTFIGQEIDLYALYRVTMKRGGYHKVSEDKTWKEIVAALQIVDKGSSAAYTLKSHYQRLLLPYEDHCKAQTTEGAGLLAAAMEADQSDDKSDIEEPQEEIMDDDEAAEILEAMLGLAPAVQASEPTKKRRKGTSRDPSSSSHSNIKIPDNLLTMVCEKCKGGHYEDKIILCDRCDKGWHMFCLSPPLETVPEGEWVCPTCISSELEGDGTRKGENYSIDDIERVSASFERQWFGSDEQAAAATLAQRESEFWRVVEEGEDIAEVLIAEDLETTRYGSGFPRRKSTGTTAEESPYAAHPWNLLNIPHAPGEHANLLRVLEDHIPGVTSPTISFSMLFSAYPWRVQPHELYGLDYLHWGAPRKHYAVPAHAAALLEAALRAALPPKLARQPEVLYKIHCLLAPRVLAASGVPLTAVTQEPGSFILTFPNAYHTAISLGVNCSEFVAFAPPDWLRFGAMSVSKYRHYRKPCSFSHERLLVRTATVASVSGGTIIGGTDRVVDPPGPRTCHWVSQELERVASEERVMRAKLWSEGLVRSRRVDQPVGMDFGDQSDPGCAICHLPLHLSAVECDCCPRRRTCLHHAANLCECPMRRRRLAWRYTLRELESLEEGLTAKITKDVVAQVTGEEREVSAAVEAVAKECSAAAVTLLEAAAANIASDNAAAAIKKEGADDNAGVAAAPSAAAAAVVPKAEEMKEEDLEALAGFMTVMSAVQPAEEDDDEGEKEKLKLLPSPVKKAVAASRKRKREEDQNPPSEAAASLTLITGNGFLQGPVRPFSILDVYPEDREAVNEWLQGLHQSCTAWRERARLALERGGGMAVDLTDLVEAAEQYLWGGVSAGDEAAVRELQPRLADAEDYMAAVNAALRGKPPLEAIEALLNQHPKPLANPPGLDELIEAATSARDWLSRCAELAAPDAPPVDVRTLEIAVNEASRLPLALPEAKALRERLNTARKVGEAIRGALPTAREAGRRKKDEAAITMDYLGALVEQATTARVDMPEVTNLLTSMEKIERWQERVHELAGVRATLTDLRDLIAEAETLPAVLPDAEHLRAMCDKAEAWLRHMQSLVRTRAPLKKLRDQLHSGVRLPVEVPEVEELRQDIRRREWEETARKVANSKGTLHALIEVLSTAADMGAENSTLALNLQEKVDAAALWERRAAAFVARVTNNNTTRAEGGACPEEERPVLEELAEVTGEGVATGVKMERLYYLTQQLQAANKWLSKARECLVSTNTGASDAKGNAAKDVSAAAAAAEKEEQEQQQEAAGEPMETDGGGGGTTGLDTLTLALAMETSQNGDEGEEPAAAPVANRAGRPRKTPQAASAAAATTAGGSLAPYDTIVALLEEYDQRLIIKAEEAAGLRRLHAAAEAWLEEARPVLEQDFVVDDQLPLLEELIAKGKATGVAMEQVDILEANVEALLWGQTVRNLLEKLPELPEDLYRKAATGGDGDDAGKKGEGVEKQGNNGTVMASTAADPSTLKPNIVTVPASGPPTLAGGLRESGLEIPAAIKLQAPPGGVPPPDADPSASDDDRPIPITPYDQRPHLTYMMSLLEEGGILPCDEEVFARFKRYVEAGQDWERAARAVLGVAKDGGPATLVGVRQLRKLILRGERLALGVPALPRLHEILRAHDKWERRVRDLMSSAGARPAFAELQVFQQTARMTPVNSNLRHHIDEAVAAVEIWKERCRRNIAKRNTGMRLDRCFEVLGHSIDCAVEQFERRLEVEKKLVAAGPRRPGPGPDGEEDERELYCLCQQPYNVDTSMISCDLCGEWYHMRCVGVTQTQARSLRKYSCPICAAVRNVMEPLEYALGKLRRTRRPTRDELGALLEEVRSLPVTVDEELSLEKLLLKFDRWATATSRAVEVHEASRKKESGGQVLPLSDGMLHQLCKSALALEIDGTDHAERILHLLRCNRWRARVDAVLGAKSTAPGGKASAESVAKLLMEADRLKVDAPADVAGARLLAAAEATKNWQQAVKTCVADLKASGGALDPKFVEAAAKAKELIKEAEKLPIRVDRELEKLNEYSKPYCLCRRAYDEQIPMLECDQCGEWFHFECVGLRGQGGSGKEAAAAAAPEAAPVPEAEAPTEPMVTNQGSEQDPPVVKPDALFEAPPAAQTTATDDDGYHNDGSEPDSVPENFCCPICCMKSGTKYDLFHKLPQASMDALKEAANAMPPPAPAAPAAATTGLPPGVVLPPGMHPQAAAAAAQMAQVAQMYGQQGAWPFAAVAAAQRGMAASQMTPQGMQQAMYEAAQAAQAAGGFPQGTHPGFMHPAMFGFAQMHPAMQHAMKAQQAAVAAAVQQQQQAQQQQAAEAAATAAAPAEGEGEEEAPVAPET